MAAWFLQCFRGKLGQDDDQDEREVGSSAEYGGQSRLEGESERERKRRLKRSNLEALKKELELLGICIDEVADQSRLRSQRRMRREYRKLLLTRMRNTVMEQLRQDEEERAVGQRLNTSQGRPAMNDRGEH